MIYVVIHYQNQIIYIYLAHAGSLPGWAKLFIKKTFFGVTCLYARSKYHTQRAKTSFDEVLDLTAVVFYFIGKSMRSISIVMSVKCFVLFLRCISVQALLGKAASSPLGKPGRTHWSRSGRDP